MTGSEWQLIKEALTQIEATVMIEFSTLDFRTCDCPYDDAPFCLRNACSNVTSSSVSQKNYANVD